MIPPLFATVNVPAVQALLKAGSGPLRVYAWGLVPQPPVKPYVVWQQVAGNPENYVGDLPDIDSFVVQVDVYADTSTLARTVATALRNAIEPVAHITSWRGESRDVETMNYRFSLDCDFWTPR